MPQVALDPATTARIKTRADLAAVVQSYLPLRKVGAQLVGLCPFHKERSPSFEVSPNGLWKCFGCGAAGDVLAFVMRAESIGFLEARRLLADRYGVALEDKPLTASEARAARLQRAYNERVELECRWFWRWYVGVLKQYRADTTQLATAAGAWIAAHPAAPGVPDARRQWFRLTRSTIGAARLLVAIQRAGPLTLDRMYRRLRSAPWLMRARGADMVVRMELDKYGSPGVTDALLARWGL